MFKISLSNPFIKQDMVEVHQRLSQSNTLFDKNVYISGASGMIASYLTTYLIWLNEKFNANISIYAGIRNPEKAEKRFGAYIEKDYFHIIQQDVLTSLNNELKLDFIIHAASLASPQYYGEKPVETMLPNLIGSYQLLDYCCKHHIQKYLFFSSGSVYGSIENIDSIREDTYGTLNFLAGGNTYGESKRCGEALSLAYFHEYNVPVNIARIHHTYGPTADIENDTRVFSEFINNIVCNKNIELKSSGSAKRAFCYLTDTICGLLTILFSSAPGEIYNVGNPDEYVSIYDLAKTLIDLFPERNLSIISGERHSDGYKASPEKRLIPLNVEKLMNLGWFYDISIREGFQRTIQSIEWNLGH